ncbi:MAG: hypothetical protein Q8Q92_04960 [bacterium]|nr:hypothetical protein [bacterium]
MKKQIVIPFGIAIVIALVLSYQYMKTATTGYGFVGTVVSMENNILVIKGLPDGGGAGTAEEITVTMTPNTKIFKKESGNADAQKQTPATMDDLYQAVKKGLVLFRLSADDDFYAAGKVIPNEVIYSTSASNGAI